MAADKRLAIPALGEWYRDLLTLDSWVNNRSKAFQAQSLLCAKLQEREAIIFKRLAYIATKRGLTLEELQSQIVQGTAKQQEEDESND